MSKTLHKACGLHLMLVWSHCTPQGTRHTHRTPTGGSGSPDSEAPAHHWAGRRSRSFETSTSAAASGGNPSKDGSSKSDSLPHLGPSWWVVTKKNLGKDSSRVDQLWVGSKTRLAACLGVLVQVPMATLSEAELGGARSALVIHVPKGQAMVTTQGMFMTQALERIEAWPHMA